MSLTLSLNKVLDDHIPIHAAILILAPLVHKLFMCIKDTSKLRSHDFCIRYDSDSRLCFGGHGTLGPNHVPGDQHVVQRPGGFPRQPAEGGYGGGPRNLSPGQ